MRTPILVSIAVLAAVSCNRDPNQVKRSYLQAGNKYFAAGDYGQASILYRRAVAIDARFAEAYYGWALAEIKLDQPADAVAPLRRAIELLPAGVESRDAKARLG